MISELISSLEAIPLLKYLSSGYRSRRKLERWGINYDPGAFLQAVERADFRAVETFLCAGMRPETTNLTGETGLVIAARCSNPKMIKLFLDRKADLETRANNLRRALLVASKYAQPESVKLLIDEGANIKAKDDRGANALIAVGQCVSLVSADERKKRDYVETFEVLLKDGRLDVNDSDKNGWTALHWVAYKDSAEAAQLLVAHGADRLKADSQGETPKSVALKNGCSSTVKYL